MDDGGSIAADGSADASDLACNQSHVSAIIAMTTPGTADAGSAYGDVMVTGRVTSTSASEIVIDACAGNTDCAPMLTTLQVTAAELDLSAAIPVGSLVNLHYEHVCPLHCWTAVAVTSVDSWGGFVNATPAPSGLYVAVDGALPEVPFSLTRQLLDCPNDGLGNCGEQTGIYALVFDDSNGTHLVAPAGQTFAHSLGNGTLSVRNLMSYQSRACDGWYQSFWVANAP